MRKFTAIAGLLLAATALPAAAMTSGQASCPVALAPAGLGAATADSLLGFGASDELDPKVEAGLSKLTKDCMTRENVPIDKLEEYTNYVMSALVAKEMKARLAAQSIPTRVIDDAFDLGPGRSNPASKDLDKAAFGEAVRKMKANGLDVTTLSDAALNDVSTYIATASSMYRLAETI